MFHSAAPNLLNGAGQAGPENRRHLRRGPPAFVSLFPRIFAFSLPPEVAASVGRSYAAPGAVARSRSPSAREPEGSQGIATVTLVLGIIRGGDPPRGANFNKFVLGSSSFLKRPLVGLHVPRSSVHHS